MIYFVDYKDKGTEHRYVNQYCTHNLFEAIETSTKVAKQLHEEYKERYESYFNESWPTARKEKFCKENAWAVRVKDDDGKTVILLNSEMLRG